MIKLEDMSHAEVKALYPDIDWSDMSLPTLYTVFGILDKTRALEERLKNIEYADGHGCCTGDCPHQSTTECTEALIEELKCVASVARGGA